jgi:hypothetical protein
MNNDFMRQSLTMNKRDVGRLTAPEREPLHAVLRNGKAAAYQSTHAPVLLTADAAGPAWRAAARATAFSVPPHSGAGMRERFGAQGLAAALTRKKPAPPAPQPLVDGEAAARRSALGGSEPPPGHARWTLRRLADTAGARALVASTSPATVRRPRQHRRCSRLCAKAGAAPRRRVARV